MSDRFTADGQDRKNKFIEMLNENGGIDFQKLQEGADKAAQDREDARREHWKEQDRQTQKRTDEINALMKKAGESSKAEREAAAAAAIEQEKAEALKAIEEKNRKKNNVYVDPLDSAYRALLKKD